MLPVRKQDLILCQSFSNRSDLFKHLIERVESKHSDTEYQYCTQNMLASVLVAHAESAGAPPETSQM